MMALSHTRSCPSRLPQVSINFVFLPVTGNVSPTDLARIVTMTEGGSTRAVLLSNPHVLYCLSITNTLPKVLLSSSTRGAAQPWQFHQYATTNDSAAALDRAVSNATLACASAQSASPSLQLAEAPSNDAAAAASAVAVAVDEPVVLADVSIGIGGPAGSTAARAGESEYFASFPYMPDAQAWKQIQLDRRAAAGWPDQEFQFRKRSMGIPSGRAADFVLLVAEDVAAVEAYYERTPAPAGTSTIVFNAIQVDAINNYLRIALAETVGGDDLDDDLDADRGGRGGASAGAGDGAGAGGTSASSSAAPSEACMVLLNTHLMSRGDKASILRRACDSGVRLIFVAPHLDPDDTEVLVASSAGSPTGNQSRGRAASAVAATSSAAASASKGGAAVAAARGARVMRPWILQAATPLHLMEVYTSLAIARQATPRGRSAVLPQLSARERASFLTFFRTLRLLLGGAASLALFDGQAVAGGWQSTPPATVSAIHRALDGMVSLSVLERAVAVAAREVLLTEQLEEGMDDIAGAEFKAADELEPPRTLRGRTRSDISITGGRGRGIGAQPELMRRLSSSAAAEGNVTLDVYLCTLVSLCVQSVRLNDNPTLDLSFEAFVRSHGACQFIPQQFRITAWVQCSLRGALQAAGLAEVPLMPPVGFNAHSRHLLTYFSEPLREQHNAPPGAMGYIATSHNHVVPWNSFLLTQAALQQELPWGDIARDHMFPSSFEVLVKLLRVYPQPLKLMCCVSPARLFELVNTVETSQGAGIVADVMSLLSDAIQDRRTMALTSGDGGGGSGTGGKDKHGDARAGGGSTPSDPFNKLNGTLSGAGEVDADGSERDGQGLLSRSALGHHVSVLKWCLLQTPWGAGRFNFVGDDLRRLIELKIPLSVAPSQAARVLPLLKQLEGLGHSNFLYQQVELRNMLLGLDSTCAPFVFADAMHEPPHAAGMLFAPHHVCTLLFAAYLLSFSSRLVVCSERLEIRR